MGFGGGGSSPPPPPAAAAPTTVPMRQLTEVQPQAQGNVRSFMDPAAAAQAGLSPFSFNDESGKTLLGS